MITSFAGFGKTRSPKTQQIGRKTAASPMLKPINSVNG
jgi:hypothetical protein